MIGERQHGVATHGVGLDGIRYVRHCFEVVDLPSDAFGTAQSKVIPMAVLPKQNRMHGHFRQRTAAREVRGHAGILRERREGAREHAEGIHALHLYVVDEHLIAPLLDDVRCVNIFPVGDEETLEDRAGP